MPILLPARPTVYAGGVKMRSKMEAEKAIFLDRHGLCWQYEPRSYASPSGIVTPDYEVADMPSPMTRPPEDGYGPRPLYIDVKGDASPATLEATRRRLEIITLSEPEAQLGIVTRIGTWWWFPPVPGELWGGEWWEGCWAACRCGIVSPAVLDGGILGWCRSCGANDDWVGTVRVWERDWEPPAMPIWGR